MNRGVAALVVSVVATPCLWGQGKPAPTPAERAKALLDEASAAPVEIFTDIALGPRLLPLLPQKEKAAVLAAVFERAGEAREPLPLRFAVLARQRLPMRGMPDGPIADREAGAALKLDALSIRCRIVQALLAIDPKLARGLFEEIAQPQADKSDCSKSLIPDTSIYLETLAAVAERGEFSDEERKKEAPWLLVERSLGGVSGAWEIVTAARIFPKFATSESRAQILSAGLAAALTQSDSDRAFTSSARQGALITPVLQAARELQQAGAPDGPILTALRGYLVRHLTAARCRDNIGEDPTSADSATFEAFAEYLDGRTDIAAISVEEHTPSKLEEGAAPGPYANAAEFEALSNEVGKVAGFSILRGAGGTFALPAGPVAPSAEFPQARARDALSRIEDLNPSAGQDPVEIFHQKCRLLGAILTAPLSDESRRAAASDAVSVLENSTILLRAPAEWLRELRFLLMQVAVFEGLSSRESASAKQPVTAAVIVNPLAASRFFALSLYARVANFSSAAK